MWVNSGLPRTLRPGSDRFPSGAKRFQNSVIIAAAANGRGPNVNGTTALTAANHFSGAPGSAGPVKSLWPMNLTGHSKNKTIFSRSSCRRPGRRQQPGAGSFFPRYLTAMFSGRIPSGVAGLFFHGDPPLTLCSTPIKQTSHIFCEPSYEISVLINCKSGYNTFRNNTPDVIKTGARRIFLNPFQRVFRA